MAQSVIDQHLMLELPEHLKIYELTTTGPHQKSHANLTAIEEKRDIVWFHIMKEEYDKIPGGIEYHPEDHDGSIGPIAGGIETSISLVAWIHVRVSCSCHLPHLLVDERESCSHITSGNIIPGELQTIFVANA